MNFVFLLLVVGVTCMQEQYPECEDAQHLPCANGQCISRFYWCDAHEDCSDGSDEKFCNGAACLRNQFRCNDNKRCIPFSGVCDDFKDCIDGSDEKNCSVNFLQSSSRSKRRANTTTGLSVDSETERAVANAAKYLLSKMTGNGWDNFTSRAVVALSFSERVWSLRKEENELMKTHLSVNLKSEFIKSKPTLTSLALYVNALYATCQDPRNYRGIDLVALLRSKADDMNSNITLPTVFLTLCIADESDSNDLNKVADMFVRSDKTGSKALAIMAMICIGRKHNHSVQKYVDYFFANIKNIQNADIYTKALFLQAADASGFNPGIHLRQDIRKHQLADGSFGDLLATYTVMPVLLNTSLLDLRCKSKKQEAFNMRERTQGSGENKLVYSIWINSSAGIDTHSIIVPFSANETFYDIMRIAASRDALYKFLYDETADGKKVYSLAGIPNDAEKGMSWVLHEGDAGIVTVNSDEYLKATTLGVDKILAESNRHFVFKHMR